MCGIAGLVRFTGLKPDEHRAGAAMADTLSHRGPDDAGLLVDGTASLGHRRLSIIDPNGGHQPVSNEDKTVHVVFNGEIYNCAPLADQLRRRGHVLRSRCDTEVIAHLYEDYGEEFVHQLNGMFAIAIWDTRRRRLLLARDRMGIKPLYWQDDGRRILFGSELKAILAAPGVTRRVDPRAICDYLTFGHVPAPRTIFENIRKLEPGCLAVCTASGTQVRRWWDIPFNDQDGDDPNLGMEEATRWVDEFSALLEDSVRLRLIADVPVGAFLSGGVDSAAVTAAMCRQSRRQVLTHTVGFEEHLHDERTNARAVAERLATDHHEVIVRPDAAWAAEALTNYYDEPFADSSAVPTYYLSRVTRQRVTVALAGDGGDEMLAGYRRYRFDLAESAFRDRCPTWLRQSILGLTGDLYPKGDWLPRTLRAKRTLQNLACDDATAHLRSVSMAAGTLPELLLRPEILAETAGYDAFDRSRELYRRCPSRNRLNRLLYLDMKTLLPDDMLTKVDRASMAVGLEVRVPLLDYRIVEFAARMPTSLKLAGLHQNSDHVGQDNKVVLRRTVANWLGADIASRPKKGFDVPVDDWFRGPVRELAHNVLQSRDATCTAWIERRSIDQLLRAHASGLRNNGAILWALLSLELWARTYAGEPAVSERRAFRPTIPRGGRHMRVLTTTMCYPTPADPDRGVFVQRRALALARLGHDIKVVSPQPWCPILRADHTGPDQDHPLPASYPRMFSIPIVGWATDGLAYARALERTIRRNKSNLDLIDAHFEYPDGVGAAMAARHLGLPVVVTVRGKIVSLSKRAGRRAQIRNMLRRVDAVIAVSQSLARCVRDVAGDDLHIDVIPNGIDPATFHSLDRGACRHSLAWNAHTRYVLAVGHLQRLKGFDRLVEIWPRVRAACGDVRLVLAGSRRGEKNFITQLFTDIDRANRTDPVKSSKPCVEFVGPQTPSQLNLMYNAADLVSSTSRSEGWCNAIAESLAVGTPVVATDVGGNREQIHSADLGTLVPDGDAASLTDAVIRAIRHNWDRSAIAAAGSSRTWEHTAREVEAVFTRVLTARRSAAASQVYKTALSQRETARRLEVPG